MKRRPHCKPSKPKPKPVRRSKHGAVTHHDLKKLERKLEHKIMSTKQDVLDAVAAEKAEVQAALAAQDAKIAELQAKVDAGGTVTSADLDDIKQAVQGIFTPAA